MPYLVSADLPRETAGSRFRALLDRPQILQLPGAHNGQAAIQARNAGFEELVVPDAAVGSARIVAAVDGRLFVEATQANNLSLKTAWVYDVASSTWLEVGPLPPAGATRGLLATQGSPASGMTSFAVAP